MADAFDAMTSNRRYRNKLDIKHAKEQLINGSGSQFDAEVVEVFIRVIIDHAEEIMQKIEPPLIDLSKEAEI